MCKNMDIKKDFCTYISTITPADLSLDILYFGGCSKCCSAAVQGPEER